MRIWVTRSEPGASELAAVLETEGHSVVKAPVLAIARLPFEMPERRFDIGLLLSVHGARYGAPLLELVDEVFAVGEQTQAACKDLGIASRVPAQMTSEGLIEALGDVAGRTILVVTGRGGRSVLQSELASRAAQVERLDVYERIAVASVEVAPPFIDAIVVSSGDGFEYAVRVWFAAGGSADVPVLVPSDRVAALAQELGMANVRNCSGADSGAVRRVLRQLAKES